MPSNKYSTPAICHPDKKAKAKGLCDACYGRDLYNRRYKGNEYWLEKFRTRSRNNSRKRRLKKEYGITAEQFESLLLQQKGLCKICGRDPKIVFDHKTTSILNIDHDHQTGIVRGLLCTLCNRGLGNFKDNPELLRKAALYLEEVNEKA